MTIMISTIILNALRRHCREQPYTAYVVMVTPVGKLEHKETSAFLPEKYQEFQDIFDKIKVDKDRLTKTKADDNHTVDVPEVGFWNIDRMIVPSTFKKECNLHGGRSMDCH
ncbi:hypothetical protein R1flu_027730 [Riccia fluitans]|uniref:Uncharacterized protein n=1 Tax=Riccia fluitans TaxID=41844 RepID=A0ABD1XJM1_9MARC